MTLYTYGIPPSDFDHFGDLFSDCNGERLVEHVSLHDIVSLPVLVLRRHKRGPRRVCAPRAVLARHRDGTRAWSAGPDAALDALPDAGIAALGVEPGGPGGRAIMIMNGVQ